MKKILLSTAAIALLFASSCKKKDDGGGSSNIWTVAGTSYSASGATLAGSDLSASTSASIPYYTIDVTFPGSGAPTAGTYKVVSTAFPNSGELSVDVSNWNSITDIVSYSSTGNGTVNATVSLTNGKVNVVIPNFWAKESGATDSVQVSANLTQTN